MIDFEITKKRKILEINNDKCHNYYYLIFGRIYNENRTKYINFKFAEWFDIFDLQEYFDKDIITKQDIKQYLDEREIIPLLNIKSYDDKKGLQNFAEYCNETLNISQLNIFYDTEKNF